ncbi:MAG: NAD(P)H-hydrate epimerase, partial [Nitrososphaerales archaeon]
MRAKARSKNLKPITVQSASFNLSTSRARRPVSSLEMRQIEEESQKAGISKMMMMENAGAAVARYVHDHFEGLEYVEGNKRPMKVVVVAGTGNNGGDGFVASRHLAYWRGKIRVSIVLLGNEDGIHTREAMANWEILRRIPGVKKVAIRNIEDLRRLHAELKGAAVIISAMFGTGFKGRPRKLQELAISRINRSKALRVSVDVPSGMEADSGKSKFAVNSDVTISM